MRVEPRSDASSLDTIVCKMAASGRLFVCESGDGVFLLYSTIVCRKAGGRLSVSENTGKSKIPLQSPKACRVGLLFAGIIERGETSPYGNHIIY